VSAFIPINDVSRPGCTACGDGTLTPRPDGEVESALRRGGGGRVTFGGAEPTQDQRLPSWIATAREHGAEAVVIETDGVRAADVEYVAALVEAGLTGVRLTLPARQTERWDRFLGCPAHLPEAWRGAEAFLAAGVELSVIIPVAQANLSDLMSLASAVVERLPEVSVTLRPVFYSPPRREGAHANDIRARARAEMVPVAELAEALAPVLRLTSDAGTRTVIDAPEGLPLCAFRGDVPAIAAVRTRRKDVGERPASCYECALLERCGGQGALDAALFGPWEVRPFDRIPPALIRNTSIEPVVLHSPGLPSSGHGHGAKAEIRVVMPCNQDCTFCFVNREAPSPSRAFLEQAVDDAVASGVLAVVFTGGEPTLSQHLAPLIARATAAGVPCRGIQTNALRLAEGELVEQLVGAGLNHAHVSLHAVDPTRYQQITGFGEPEDAARGARRLVDAGVEVSISLVICQANVDHVTPTLAFIREAVGPVKVVLSVAREQLGVPRPWDQTLLRFTDAAAAMIEALEAGQALGLSVGSAGTCSMPPCVLPRDKLEAHADAVLVTHRTMTWDEPGEQASHSDANVFVSVCEDCALKARCPGIQRTYLERHGDGEFSALAPLNG
jgi:molybdenum cofactor biosynthesis enzyme MoaA